MSLGDRRVFGLLKEGDFSKNSDVFQLAGRVAFVRLMGCLIYCIAQDRSRAHPGLS